MVPKEWSSTQPALENGKKRKAHPSNPSSESSKRPRTVHRGKQRDARFISSQAASKVLKNGELDVDAFVKAREYEIRALEESVSRSKKALNTRAFQQVPKELRRRTASHNAKRVPKRLRLRAEREMVEDNTPTVTAKKRKPTKHMRLRIETAKKLRLLGRNAKAMMRDGNGKVIVRSLDTTSANGRAKSAVISTRLPKVKKSTLASRALPKAKFRKRQMNKTWLPTHMFHAKRARMTPPQNPLWKFAMPLTPTAKSYRPTHRAANEKGAVVWDVSYSSTIRVEGQHRSIEGLLRALGVGTRGDDGPWARQGQKWRNGTRVWTGFLYELDDPHQPMAPATVFWRVEDQKQPHRQNDDPQKHKRTIFIRVHPSAFFQVWYEVVAMSKVVKPELSVEDLRFEIGSIEVAGPGAIEALQGALWPSPPLTGSDVAPNDVRNSWKILGTLNGQAALPAEVLFAFEIQDPRLHYPPRPLIPSKARDERDRLLELLVAWPVDSQQDASSLFQRRNRLSASAALPSQKSINRRKALSTPGQYPEPSPKDPRIPVVLYCRTCRGTREQTWTVLLPWKCVPPVWYSIMYYPLTTGGQPRFGGLDEMRQLAFENGQPWFPSDFPGTQAGWTWELQERVRLRSEWLRRPRAKRTNWNAVKLGNGREGEIGAGWACDWERLLKGPSDASAAQALTNDAAKTKEGRDTQARESVGPEQKPSALMQMSNSDARAALESSSADSIAPGYLATVRLKVLTRGVPQTCSRIYRLPTTESGGLRKRWLDLHPQNQARAKPKGSKHSLPPLPKDAPKHVVRHRLAQSLIEPPRPGETGYPPCPPEEDLIGFVTSGNFNLGEGKGTGVGNIALAKVADAARRDSATGQLCIVRNAGNEVGRLARWELV